MTGALAPERSLGDPPQLLLDQGKEPVHDAGMAVAQLEEQLCNGLGVGGIG